MKKRKIIVMIMAAVMLISCMAPAGNVTVSAKNKLVRKVSYYVGQKQQWWMTLNFKKVNNKKVKWKSSNKKVAAVSKKGVIRAKKKGKAKITAKYKKNTLVIKVTVKENTPIYTGGSGTNPTTGTTSNAGTNTNTNTLTTTQLAANLVINAQPVKDGSVLFTITNNNAQKVQSYKINYMINDAAGTAIDTGNLYGYAIEPGQTQYNYAYLGKEKAAKADMTKSVCSVTVQSFSTLDYVNRTSDLSVTYQQTADNDIAFTYQNNSTEDISVRNMILFYDAEGQLVAVDRDSVSSLAAGETKFTSLITPYDYDDDFNKVPTFATYQVITSAYSISH